jgi:hypothetical protein
VAAGSARVGGSRFGFHSEFRQGRQWWRPWVLCGEGVRRGGLAPKGMWPGQSSRCKSKLGRCQLGQLCRGRTRPASHGTVAGRQQTGARGKLKQCQGGAVSCNQGMRWWLWLGQGQVAGQVLLAPAYGPAGRHGAGKGRRKKEAGAIL